MADTIRANAILLGLYWDCISVCISGVSTSIAMA
jgi:hypothetical protein